MSGEVDTAREADEVDIDLSEAGPEPAQHAQPDATWPSYMLAARRSWWIVLIAIVAGGLGAYLVSTTGSATYESSATVALVPQPDVVGVEEMFEVTKALGVDQVTTVGELFETDSNLRTAANTLGMDPDMAASRYDVVAAGSLQGLTVGLLVTGPDAMVASDLAAALPVIVSEQYTGMYPGLGVDIIDTPAGEPGRPIESGSFVILVGVLIGLGIGFLLAVARGPGTEADPSASRG